MKYHEFVCPECEKTVHSSYRIFECPRCGYEPPIEDYKKAFEDLQEVVEYKKSEISKWSKSAWESGKAIKMPCECCFLRIQLQGFYWAVPH